jgi:hypothetical protein
MIEQLRQGMVFLSLDEDHALTCLAMEARDWLICFDVEISMRPVFLSGFGLFAHAGFEDGVLAGQIEGV